MPQAKGGHGKVEQSAQQACCQQGLGLVAAFGTADEHPSALHLTLDSLKLALCLWLDHHMTLDTARSARCARRSSEMQLLVDSTHCLAKPRATIEAHRHCATLFEMRLDAEFRKFIDHPLSSRLVSGTT